MSSVHASAIPIGSTVLVTGANGYIASHIADKLLGLGYNVRGTVRDPKRHQWMIDMFDKQYGKGKFELFHVPDMATEGAFDNAVKGASAVIHTATVMNMSSDPHKVIPPAIAGAVGALKSAASESSVKRFVLTSSSSAVLNPCPNQEVAIDENSWNEEATEAAWKPPPFEPSRAFEVYGASKAQSEQAVWRWFKENKPDLVLNTIIPCGNFGRVLDPDHQGWPSSAEWIANLYKGEKIEAMRPFPPLWFVDVEDDALLHVAATIMPDVQSQRIFAYAEPINFDQVLSVLRTLYPNREFVKDFHSDKDLTIILLQDKAKALLKRLGRSSWTTLQDSVSRTLTSREDSLA